MRNRKNGAWSLMCLRKWGRAWGGYVAGKSEPPVAFLPSLKGTDKFDINNTMATISTKNKVYRIK